MGVPAVHRAETLIGAAGDNLILRNLSSTSTAAGGLASEGGPPASRSVASALRYGRQGHHFEQPSARQMYVIMLPTWVSMTCRARAISASDGAGLR